MYKYESPPGVVTQMQLLGILKQFQVNILTLLLRFLGSKDISSPGAGRDLVAMKGPEGLSFFS